MDGGGEAPRSEPLERAVFFDREEEYFRDFMDSVGLPQDASDDEIIAAMDVDLAERKATGISVRE